MRQLGRVLHGGAESPLASPHPYLSSGKSQEMALAASTTCLSRGDPLPLSKARRVGVKLGACRESCPGEEQ